jgi:hypothetical protein
VGLPGVLLCLVFMTATEPPRRTPARREAGGESVFRFLRGNAAQYLSLFLAVGLLGLLSIGTAAWYPTFLMRLHGFSAAQAGYCYGVVLLTAGSLGVLAGGYLSDALIARGIGHANIRIMQYSTALKLIPLIVGPLLTDIRGVIAMLALATFIGQLSSGVAIACLQAITPDQYRARVSAVMLLVVNLLALGIGATYVALITDYVFADEMAIHYSLALTAATVGPAILLLLWWYRRETGAPAANRVAAAAIP